MFYKSSAVIIISLYKQNFSQTFYTSILYMCGIIITIIPLSKMYYTKSNACAASNLHAIEKKYNIKTYQANNLIPEIIRSYGSSIPLIKNAVPEEPIFGLLAHAGEFTAFKQKVYSNRLIENYYIVSNS